MKIFKTQIELKPSENETVCKTSTIHTVPLPPDPLESANKTKVQSNTYN